MQCDRSFLDLLLVASLRSQFSLVYLCVQFVFSATALHFLVRWISRLIALWSKGVYIPSLHFFSENNHEPWPVFSRPLANEDLFFLTIMRSYTSENNCSGQWRCQSTGRMYKINRLAWLSFLWLNSFCGTMFLFGCAFCNTSTYCMLTLWLSWVNYALRGEFPLLHRLLQYIFTYALFWLPRVNFSLKNLPPYFTISFSWNKRLLEPKFLCDECSVNLYNFFAKVTTLLLKWKRISSC